MTACSNHPGTPAGLALAELFAESEQLAAALQLQEIRWCAELDLERDDWRLLRAAAAGVASRDELCRRLVMTPSALDGRLLMLAGRGFFDEDPEQPAQLQISAEGLLQLAHLDRCRYDWIDTLAEGLEPAGLRDTGDMLRRLVALLRHNAM